MIATVAGGCRCGRGRYEVGDGDARRGWCATDTCGTALTCDGDGADRGIMQRWNAAGGQLAG